MARNYSSVVEPKTLTGTVSSAATQITLNNVTGLPSPPYILVINPDTAKEEAVLVTVDQTGVTSPTLKVQRAVEASGGLGTAQDHTIGDTVKHMIVGSDLQIVHDHFSDNSLTAGTAHGVSGGVVGRTSSQTLTNKTINLTDNTLTGTTAQFNTALSDADFATTALLEARVPVGAVNMWVTATAPSGWLLCQGQEVPVADYSALAAVLSTTYGALTNGSGGAGTTHFRLPDLRGRTPMGAGTGAGGGIAGTGFPTGGEALTARTLGGFTGDERTPKHTHSNTVSGTFASSTHGHTVSNDHTSPYHIGNGVYYTEGNTIADVGNLTTFGPSATASVSITNVEAGTGNSANIQPSTVINFIIKH